MILEYISAAILISVSLFIIKLIFILPFFKIDSNDTTTKDSGIIDGIKIRNGKNIEVFIFLGSGGHTGEMIRILQNYKNILLDGSNVMHVGYSDMDSYNRFKAMMKEYKCKVNYYEFVKARKVGAGIVSSICSITKTLLMSLRIIFQIRISMLNKPHLVLLNGPGTCCIIALYFKLIEWLSLVTDSPNIVYVESLARIDTLSLSGKILYWLADEFLVQWKELKEKNAPRAKFFGILV
ncbi:hypothetical protein TPHA_0A03940 [Tetrapisispora phaffii CBS 4417]|uniref:UDP-N-acetylglucosamine transferase subunit ALG14 n=1 Tax=Tetrapisispora phaffii (strain ATCC 24235 / CBS 4417 / NBRC 1672 / NRRL Y-8282 / UCD 70-5) TaxID=1071381 RepID=G8BNJ2_TETPH|nr:hypothetical protein TPHA_0A03940 [Tetrapisispora phaffii CBS 4417]CCE61470.1 hypothetical protein TPHA_0A03940 [Tetrapisispora phaffii CBS 4417]